MLLSAIPRKLSTKSNWRLSELIVTCCCCTISCKADISSLSVTCGISGRSSELVAVFGCCWLLLRAPSLVVDKTVEVAVAVAVTTVAVRLGCFLRLLAVAAAAVDSDDISVGAKLLESLVSPAAEAVGFVCLSS